MRWSSRPVEQRVLASGFVALSLTSLIALALPTGNAIVGTPRDCSIAELPEETTVAASISPTQALPSSFPTTSSNEPLPSTKDPSQGSSGTTTNASFQSGPRPSSVATLTTVPALAPANGCPFWIEFTVEDSDMAKDSLAVKPGDCEAKQIGPTIVISNRNETRICDLLGKWRVTHVNVVRRSPNLTCDPSTQSPIVSHDAPFSSSSISNKSATGTLPGKP